MHMCVVGEFIWPATVQAGPQGGNQEGHSFPDTVATTSLSASSEDSVMGRDREARTYAHFAGGRTSRGHLCRSQSRVSRWEAGGGKETELVVGLNLFLQD